MTRAVLNAPTTDEWRRFSADYPTIARSFEEVLVMLTRSFSTRDRVDDVLTGSERARLLNTENATVNDTEIGPFAGRLNGEAGQIEDRRALPVTLRAGESVVSGLTLTATDAGSDATIALSAWTLTLDGATTSYTSGAVAGLPYSTTHYVYVDDEDFDGVDVTYVATTDRADITANAFRIYLGSITTPAAAGSPVVIDIPDRFSLLDDVVNLQGSFDTPAAGRQFLQLSNNDNVTFQNVDAAAISGDSVAAVGAVSGATVAATGAVSGATVTATGDVTGANLTTAGVVQVDGVTVVREARTGWTPATGSQDRGAYDAFTGSSISDPPTQAEVEGLRDELAALSQRLVALQVDLQQHHGLLSA